MWLYKEVYKFPNITYPYNIYTPAVSALFCNSIPTFCSFLKLFFVLVYVIFVQFYNKELLLIIYKNILVKFQNYY